MPQEQSSGDSARLTAVSEAHAWPTSLFWGRAAPRGRPIQRPTHPVAMPRFFAASLSAVAAALVFASWSTAAGSPEVAALQVGLRGRGLYVGTVDGVLGPGTENALRRFQRRAGLAADGVPGPRTRKALGRYGRRAPLGRRTLALGSRGWDVAALQFALAWHGFPSGTFDGYLGAHSEAALRSFQAWAGIPPDGAAGPSTISALRMPLPHSPITFARPLPGPTGGLFR